MDLTCNIEHFQIVELYSGHKTRVNKTVNLYNFLRFCDNSMYTVGPNNKQWLIKATEMDANGFYMLNDSDFTLLTGNGGGAVKGLHAGKI